MKNLKRVLVLVLVLVMAVSLLSGCTSSKSSGTSSGNSSGTVKASAGKDMNKDNIKIGFIPLSLLGSVNVPIGRAILEAFSQYPNVKVDSLEAKYDATNQVALINQCIEQKYNAIILEVTDPAAVSNAVTAAEKAGIPVITSEINCNALHTCHIQASDYNAGLSAGEHLMKLMGDKGNLVILDGDAAQATIRKIGVGCEDYLKAHNSKIKVLTHQYVTNWSQETANTMMRDILTKYSDIQGAYVCNDDMAVGAINAMKAAGRNKDIVVWGFAGTEAGFAAIKDGSLQGTNFMDTYTVTMTQLTTALFCVANGLNVNSLGYKTTPIITLSSTLVTKDNIDTYLAINRYGK